MAHPIAVIGGGIAGASAILSLAKCGATPIWIAPENTQVDRVGESLAPAAHRTLNALGVEDLVQSPVHRRSNATFSAWGSDQLIERNSISQIEGSGWVLDRACFEQELIARASDHIAPLRRSAQSVTRSGKLWSVTLEDGGVVETDFLLDATGRNALIGRQLACLRRTDQLVAAWSILEQQAQDVEPTRATLIEAVEDGWWYAALLPDGRIMVAWFTDPDLIASGLSRELSAWQKKLKEPRYVRRWIEDAGFAPATPATLATAGTTWLEPCAGQGWAAIGDAAAAFDPLSSHGMTTALWSGHAAAQAVVAERDGNTGALDAYARKVAEGVQTFLSQRDRFYAAERRFRDAPFWSRRRREAAA